MEHFLRSLENSWQPFVLVIGLLLVGHSAASEGLFDWLGRLIARTPGGALRVFVVTMLAVAVVFLPIVLAYTTWVFRVMKGRGTLETLNAHDGEL